ncbi:MAG: pinensin family lanthipeptide [Cyclobacteriaceae bacterium]
MEVKSFVTNVDSSNHVRTVKGGRPPESFKCPLFDEIPDEPSEALTKEFCSMKYHCYSTMCDISTNDWN